MTTSTAQHIATYRLDNYLWDSSLGTVYQAHSDQGAPVLLLSLFPDINQQISIQRQFIAAARSVARCEHPSILRIHEANQANGRFYATMPYVSGVNLGKLIESLPKGTRFETEESLLLIAQLAEAMAYAHEQHLIHYALSPWSIVIKRQPQAAGFPFRAMVADLGIGRLQHSLISNTPERLYKLLPYFAPEQTLAQAVDHRTDLFTLGVILFQLLTGEHPFPIEKPTDTVLLHIKGLAALSETHQSTIPTVVQKIILTALEKSPEERYQTGKKLATALRNAALQLAKQTPRQPCPQSASIRDYLPVTELDRLFIYGNGETARIMPLDKRVMIIGRSRTSDVRLPSESISRHHVRLEQTDNGWLMIDLNSTNGAFLDGVQVTPNYPHSWQKDQALKIGAYLLKWR